MSPVAEADVGELRRRLREAEDTLRALQEGEADALLVRTHGEDQVFHLGGGADSYRAFMESMDLGAAALDGERQVLYANAALARLLGRTTEALQQDGLFEALGPAARTAVRQRLDRGPDGHDQFQLSLQGAAGRRDVQIQISRLPLSFGDGFALTFTDITDRMAAAAAQESERIGRAIMASASEAVVVCDVKGAITHASPAVSQIIGRLPVGETFEAAFPLTFPPGAGAIAADDLVGIALAGSAVRGIEASLAGGKELVISCAPIRLGDGSLGGAIINLVDLTERKALEKRQTLLMHELDHRIKNMLTLVQSVASRTLATSEGLSDFRERFNQRIAALATTQNLLSLRTGAGLTIGELVSAELAPFAPIRSAHLVTDGLDVMVSRDAAVSLGLVLHELATNAVKYGALSIEGGQVSVAGERLDNGDLRVTWRESGGPAVAKPTRSGFGSTVIERGLGQCASRPTEVVYDPAGLVCVMTLAAEMLDA